MPVHSWTTLDLHNFEFSIIDCVMKFLVEASAKVILVEDEMMVTELVKCI